MRGIGSVIPECTPDVLVHWDGEGRLSHQKEVEDYPNIHLENMGREKIRDALKIKDTLSRYR